MKVLFMGTPPFAAVSLEALARAGHEVAAAVTRPDAAAGRGLKPRPSAVKQAAAGLGIPVWQPAGLKGLDLVEQVRLAAPDIVVVAAFGRLLPRWLLEAAPGGAVNVHASLLPRYRGAAPVAWAIVAGERETGVTIMRMIERLDAGDILMQASVPILEDDTTGSLETRLAEAGADLLIDALAGLQAGTVAATPQDESAATYAPSLRKQDALVDWGLDAAAIARRVRAFDPSPVAHTRTAGPSGVTLRIWKAMPFPEGATPLGALPGTILGAPPRGKADGGILVACGEGTVLALLEVQPEGRRRMTAREAASGRYVAPGDRLGGA